MYPIVHFTLTSVKIVSVRYTVFVTCSRFYLQIHLIIKTACGSFFSAAKFLPTVGSIVVLLDGKR